MSLASLVAAACQAQNRTAGDRIVAGEVGCFRRNPGCADHLSNVLSVLGGQGWH